MTQLPPPSEVKLGLVIDLDTCVGCHACVVACKGWNTENYGAPLGDEDPYGAEPVGSFLNRVHSYEVQPARRAPAQLVHFPKSCLHCEDAPCVTVCPTGPVTSASKTGLFWSTKRLYRLRVVCLGLPLRRTRDWMPAEGVMKKCTLCVDRIYNENLPGRSRPACVRTCPAGARHFGTLRSDSDVSELVAARARL